MNLQYHTILGEEDLKGYFRSAVRTGNISHAYILSGETGSGKRMIAEAFAAALLCKDPLGGEACGPAVDSSIIAIQISWKSSMRTQTSSP